jgi:alkanesulfonate monooxygenase SsuD/methylene tetrahydromethanopterin reductase-like flavin-dependent oxidoreductase (luciferase family)
MADLHGVDLRAPGDIAGSPVERAFRQPLLLGVFLNLQDMRRSSIPNTSTWTFDYNAEVVKTADALGFELAFSRTQWLPKGGYDGDASLDAFIALGAMAAVTQNILLISTVHVLYGPWHPLHFAKFGATLDHISKGRWGVNIVTGHRAVEHEMFGGERIEHDRRYALAGEFFDVVQRLWGETENYSFEGQSPWRLKDAYVTPKPQFGRPLLVNATGSEAGIDFAAQYSDIVFITSPGGAHIDSALDTLPAHTAAVRRAAEARGRRVRTLINPIIVCRDTEREAHDYARQIVAMTSRTGKQDYDSDAHAWRGRRDSRHQQGLGLGGNIEIIGTPQQVVEQLQALNSTGIDGVQLSFHDFQPDLEHFGARVLPLLKQAGLRL